MLEQPNQPIKMKHIIAKNTLSFMTSKSYKFVRTPLDIWESLTKEFAFTLDACIKYQSFNPKILYQRKFVSG